MAGGSRASVDLAVLMLFCAACSVASADNISTFALQEDLFRYACTLDSNLTLEGEVSSRIRARHNNGVVTGRIREYYPQSHVDEMKVISRRDRCSKTAANLTWCITLWHPDINVHACISSNGQRNATAAAEQLGLLDDLTLTQCNGRVFCLKIDKTKYYYHMAFISSLAHSPKCIDMRFNLLRIVQDGIPQVHAVQPVVYAPYGTSASLRCDMYDSLLAFYSGWLLNGTDVFMCEGQERDECNSNITRVRGYRVTLQEACGSVRAKKEVELVIDSVTSKDSGNYTCLLDDFFFGSPTDTVTLHAVPPVYQPEFKIFPNQSVLVVQEGDRLEILCTVVTGLGADVYWKLPLDEATENISESGDTSGVRVMLKNLTHLPEYKIKHKYYVIIDDMSAEMQGVYSLVVNDLGYPENNVHEVLNITVTMAIQETAMTSHPYQTDVPDQENDNGHQMRILISIGIVGSVLAVAVCLMTVTSIVVCIQQQHHGHFKKRKDTHVPVMAQNPQLVLSMERSADMLEFPRSKVTKITRLADGTFGEVHLARLEVAGDSGYLVAVKEPRYAFTPASDFAHELKVMTELTPHPNIINLLGCCTNPAEGPTLLILEYAPHGSLKQFLQSCLPNPTCHTHLHSGSSSGYWSSSSSVVLSRPPLSAQTSILSTTTSASSAYISFNGHPIRATSSLASSSSCSESPQHQCTCQDDIEECGDQDLVAVADTFEPSLAHKLWPLNHDYINAPQPLLLEDIHNFGLQIATGLEHLKKMKVVHCDLAARNILLTRDHTLKIADFGMSQVIDEKHTGATRQERVPLKWTAPESLESCLYTYYSDIWSYGVVLWEIFTYGSDPYSELTSVNLDWDSMIAHLKDGNRPLQPPDCPTFYYELMQSCWQISPPYRPTASELVHTLTNMSPDSCAYHHKHQNKPTPHSTSV